MSRLLLTRTQKPSLEEKYEIYLMGNGYLENASRNPLNLFDTNNAEDKAWYSLAQIYMVLKKEG